MSPDRRIVVDVAVLLIAARHDAHPVGEEVRQGRFREDLYYRVNVVTIDLPPLCERVGDVRLLAEHFLRMYSTQHNRKKLGITDEAMEYLERYPWPGNVRELENVIERATLLSKGKFIGPEDLPDSIKREQSRQTKQYKSIKTPT